VAGRLGTELLAENETAVAFRDINPLAKVHILVVPRKHSRYVSDLTDSEELVGLFALIRQVSAHFTDGQFRLQFNSGEKEGQTIFHTHAHILSGRAV
jgi:histidine triad (HIT) family protein